jgi:hypothetical protein
VQGTFSKRGAKWSGFRPIPYSLGEEALNLPLKRIVGNEIESRDEDSTIWDVLKTLGDREFELEANLHSIVLTTESEVLSLKGSMFACGLASVIIGLWKQGTKPGATRWFWLESSISTEDPVASHSFFVVDDKADRIVRDEVQFLDTIGGEFDPAVLEYDENPPFWTYKPRSGAALAAYWYRRFYRETKLGQLIVLETGAKRPVTYYYPEGRPWHNRHICVLGANLRIVPFLMWFAVFIVFIMLWLIRT